MPYRIPLIIFLLSTHPVAFMLCAEAGLPVTLAMGFPRLPSRGMGSGCPWQGCCDGKMWNCTQHLYARSQHGAAGEPQGPGMVFAAPCHPLPCPGLCFVYPGYQNRRKKQLQLWCMPVCAGSACKSRSVGKVPWALACGSCQHIHPALPRAWMLFVSPCMATPA